ncbi:MAG: glycosyltransferase [Halomonas sp.]
MKQHIFILIRYSILTQSRGAWVIGRDKEFEDYKAHLFDSQRLAIHEKLFKEVTVPSLSKMKKSDTTVIVFTSDELPEPFLSNLHDIAKNAGNIKVFGLSRDQPAIARMHQQLSKELKVFAEDVCYATVRLDDDDALADNYYQELSKYLSPAFVGHSISFAQGYAGLYDGSVYTKFYPMNLPKCALGLAHIHLYNKGKRISKTPSIYALGAHTRIDEKAPLILSSEQSMYIRTIHKGSDMYGEKILKKVSGGKMPVNYSEVKDSFSILPAGLHAEEKEVSFPKEGMLVTSHNTLLCYSFSNKEIVHSLQEEVGSNSDLEPLWFDSKSMKTYLKARPASSSNNVVELLVVRASNLAGNEGYYPEALDDQKLVLVVEQEGSKRFLCAARNGQTQALRHCKAWEKFTVFSQ